MVSKAFRADKGQNSLFLGRTVGGPPARDFIGRRAARTPMTPRTPMNQWPASGGVLRTGQLSVSGKGFALATHSWVSWVSWVSWPGTSHAQRLRAFPAADSRLSSRRQDGGVPVKRFHPHRQRRDASAKHQTEITKGPYGGNR